TPNAKVEATRVFEAEVILEGADFEATRLYTEQLARDRNLTLIHPFDDSLVIAGQGTVALEMHTQVPELDVVVVPVGGGGLIGGCALAYKSLSPSTEVIGVQVERYPGAFENKHARSVPRSVGGTVAEGIAVKQPGARNLQLIEKYVDRIDLVSETQVEQAIFDLLEIEKTVAEGAGAAPLAALFANRAYFAGRKVGLVVSGGNIDMMILSSILTRCLARNSRLVRLKVEIPDTPGALAALTAIVGELDSNIVDIEHHRAFAGSSVRATVVELTLQMRGEEQRGHVVHALEAADYLVSP
ncbi:MAG: threonine dehydratase, partial [Candidatus Azotimanducaceae bacterium]